MIARLHRLRKERLNGDRGFTLTELLVVIVIIGILVAIAIPVFLSQRAAAQERAIESDVRNAIPVMETYYANKNAYPALTGTAITTSGPIDSTTGAPRLTITPDVTLKITTTGEKYVIVGTHSALGTLTYTYDSSAGNMVKSGG